ncbi:MAG: hypothetical protein WBZ29_02115 [Methanocella sp.]
MIGLSWEMAGYILAFQVLQTIVAGMLIALLLWYEKMVRAHRGRAQGDSI